jgi:hypothetical protein
VASDDHQADVRIGSKPEVAVLPGHVCLTPQSGHRRSPSANRKTPSRWSFSTDEESAWFFLSFTKE